MYPKSFECIFQIVNEESVLKKIKVKKIGFKLFCSSYTVMLWGLLHIGISRYSLIFSFNLMYHMSKYAKKWQSNKKSHTTKKVMEPNSLLYP